MAGSHCRSMCLSCEHTRKWISLRPSKQGRRASFQARAIKDKHAELLEMGSKFKRRYRISNHASFPEYLVDQLVGRVQQYNLPLGASLTADGQDELILQVPRVSLLDLYIFPTSRLSVDYGTDRVSFRAVETSLRGSHHIESLELNDRFDLDLHVDISVKGEILSCAADFQLKVDIPFPFSMTPAPVLKATGNAAVTTVVAQLMDVLARSMVTDHQLWLLESQSESESECDNPVLTSTM